MFTKFIDELDHLYHLNSNYSEYRGTANILTIIYAKPSDVPGLAFFLTLSPIVRATPPGLPITHLPVVSAVVMS